MGRCIQRGLVSGRLVATDSTHVKANASPASERLMDVMEKPEAYWDRLDAYEEEGLEAPTLTTPFYMDARLEDAPTREKIGAPGSGESKPRRRHRGGRRRGGKSAENAEQSKAEAKRPEQKESKPRPPRQESKPPQPKPAEGQSAAPGGEGETKRRRRPHHRGGRRRNKNGGEGGSAPKSE